MRSFFGFVLFAHQVVLLLRREVAPSQLVLTNPSENFFSAFKRERHGGEINLRVFLEDGITIVSVNKGVVPHDQRREQLALFEDIFFKLLITFRRLMKESRCGMKKAGRSADTTSCFFQAQE